MEILSGIIGKSVFLISLDNILFGRIIGTITVIICAYLIMVIIRKSIDKISRRKVRKHFRKTTYHVFQLIIWITALFIILGIWGISPTALLAGAGFMGIVVGLGGQQTIGNVISGILMMFTRPFEIGDWITFKDYTGIVLDISIFYTEIETFNGEIISVPNQLLTSNPLDNKTRKGILRTDVEIGIDYESDSELAKKLAVDIMKNHERIVNDPAPQALVTGIGSSTVNIRLRFWVKDPTRARRRQTIDEINTRVKKKWEEEGIEIAFPHLEIIEHGGKWKFKNMK